MPSAWVGSPPTWRALWGARPDPIARSARSLSETVRELGVLGGVLGGPWRVVDGGLLPQDDAGWEALTTASVQRDDRGEPLGVRGRHVVLTTRGPDAPPVPYALLSASVGSTIPGAPRPSNHVSLTIDPASSTSDTWTASLRAVAEDVTVLLAEAWRPDAVELIDRRIVDLHLDDLRRPSSWPRTGPVSWLSERTWPSAVGVEIPGATVRAVSHGTLVTLRAGDDLDLDPASARRASEHLADIAALGPVPPVQGASS